MRRNRYLTIETSQIGNYYEVGGGNPQRVWPNGIQLEDPAQKNVGGFCDGIQTLEFGGCESSIFATHPHFSSLIISYVPRCTRTVTSLQLKEGATFELEGK